MNDDDLSKVGDRAAALHALLQREGLVDEHLPAALMCVATTLRLNIPRETWLEGCRVMREFMETALKLAKEPPP